MYDFCELSIYEKSDTELKEGDSDDKYEHLSQSFMHLTCV
jgi:hypothetical protein